MADDYGYVRIHRKIKKNPVWNVKPFSKGQAWVDMIMNANHEPTDLVLGNEVIHIERGQFHTSELKLSDDWGWSRKKVRAYLALLKNLKMATTQGTSKGTTITIENYSDYQWDGTTEGTAQGTLKEPRRNREGYTNNNDNNDNNIITPYPLTEFSFSADMENQILIWLKYKTERKESYKPTGFKTLLGQIKKQAAEHGDQAVIDLINVCMASNWQGIIWDKLKKSDKPESPYREI